MNDDEIFYIRNIVENHPKESLENKRSLMRYYLILIDRELEDLLSQTTFTFWNDLYQARLDGFIGE